MDSESHLTAVSGLFKSSIRPHAPLRLGSKQIALVCRPDLNDPLTAVKWDSPINQIALLCGSDLNDPLTAVKWDSLSNQIALPV
jgi:hypothetical protein